MTFKNLIGTENIEIVSGKNEVKSTEYDVNLLRNNVSESLKIPTNANVRITIDVTMNDEFNGQYVGSVCIE
jgi:hypothetical protein